MPEPDVEKSPQQGKALEERVEDLEKIRLEDRKRLVNQCYETRLNYYALAMVYRGFPGNFYEIRKQLEKETGPKLRESLDSKTDTELTIYLAEQKRMLAELQGR